VSKRVDSDALNVVTKALGLTGRGSQITEFLDGQLDQVFDVSAAIRRGRTLASTEGLFTGVIRNIHVSDDSVTTTVRPYNMVPDEVIAPWTTPIPDQFDIWVLQATLSRESGTGTLVRALLDSNWDSQGWGVDSAGDPVISSPAMPLAFWDALVVEQGVAMGIRDGTRGPVQKIGLRLPRIGNPSLVLRTTSGGAAAAEFQVDLILGLFPVALGQDGIV